LELVTNIFIFMRARFFMPIFWLAGCVVFAQMPGAPAPSAANTDPSTPAPAPTVKTAPPLAPAPMPPDPKNPRSWLWEYWLPSFTEKDYRTAVDALFADYETRLGRKLEPGAKRRVGLKVMTNSTGLTTPLPLVRAVIAALEARGFKPAELFIVDQSVSKLHAAGFLPLVSAEGDVFDGVPVSALERGQDYDLKWNYESPLPAPDSAEQQQTREDFNWKIKLPNDRLTLLPVPLLLKVDFWINLPVGMDYGDFGVAGGLVNATLLAGSNTQRFFNNPQTGAVAVAEMAAIPELDRGWVFTLMSLEHFQFVGGPKFNSLYSGSEPVLWMSANPVVIDSLLFERINSARKQVSVPLLDRPAYIEYAHQLDLGDFAPDSFYRIRLP
jgi:hypothetical protein